MLRSTARLLRQAGPLRRAPHPSLHLSGAVRKALSPSAPQPLVALESTIITHGLPYPYNLDVALELEAVVRDHGAVPATIALLDGRPLVGLEQADLERLARCAEDPSTNTAIKASRRDISHVLAKGKGAVGGTTVSGTMVLAHMAGIEIFATGGIGGVHRGGETSFDISADLSELGRTPVSVFCSGPKSILDIPRTLEVLETNGVSVQTFNPSGEFPAFYTSSSGLFVPYVGSTTQAAASILINAQLALNSGQVFGVPIPSSFEAVGNEIQKNVEIAVRESVEQGIDRRGKEATPWLLKRLAQLIPASKESNRALVVNNARVAAQTAAEMERIRQDFAMGESTYSLGGIDSSEPARSNPTPLPSPRSDILVFGAAAIDVTSQASSATSSPPAAATTYPGVVSLSLGGVSRNLAEAAFRVLQSPLLPASASSAIKLVSPRGDDAFGQLLEQGLRKMGMRTDGLFVPVGRTSQEGEEVVARTAVCSLTLTTEGDLISGVADMDIGQRFLVPLPSSLALSETKEAGSLEGALTSYLGAAQPRLVVFDGNVGVAHLSALLDSVAHHNRNLSAPQRAITLFEPTSLAKSLHVLTALSMLRQSSPLSPPPISISTPNVLELTHMHAHAVTLNLLPPATAEDDAIASQMRSYLALPPFIPSATLHHATSLVQSSLFDTLLVKFGANGVLSVTQNPDGFLSVKHHPAPQLPLAPSPDSNKTPAPQSLNTTGAGDSFAGGIVAGIYSLVTQTTSTPQDYRSDHALDKIILLGQLTAGRSLVSPNAVGSNLETLLKQSDLLDTTQNTKGVHNID